MRMNAVMTTCALGLSGTMSAGQTFKQDAFYAPVVVELFTSQGCSSCPPADELLHELAARPDVIALAMHVDYWDYIGWTDVFALPAHTSRQKGYAKAAGRRMIYTPQMIINGTDHVVGNHPLDVNELIALHETRAQSVLLSLDGGEVIVSLQAEAKTPGDMRILLVDFEPTETVEITRGENAGRTIDYANIVQSWQEMGRWDGTGEYRAQLPDVESAVVLVQVAEYGPVVAARALP